MPRTNALDQFKILTFDCYGTLIDWESGILGAVLPVLERHHVELDEAAILEKYARFEERAEAGGYKPYVQVLEAVIDEFGRACGFEPSAVERSALWASLPQWRPFPDTVDALQALRRKYRLAILSNIDDALFAHTASQLRVPFDYVFTAEQIGSYKPDPRNFEFLLRRLPFAAGEVLHVAQSLFHDIVPAQQMGLATVWINRREGRAGSGATSPARAVPDYEFADLRALVEAAGI